MDDVAVGQRRVLEMGMQEIPAAAGGDRTGLGGIGAELDVARDGDPGDLALRIAPAARAGDTLHRLVGDLRGAAQKADLGVGLDEAQFPDQRADIDEVDLGQRRLQSREPRQRHAIGIEVEPDPGADQATVGEAFRQHGKRIFPVAVLRHVGDPVAPAARPGIERPDQEERLLLDGNDDAAPTVLGIAVARDPVHRLDLVEQGAPPRPAPAAGRAAVPGGRRTRPARNGDDLRCSWPRLPGKTRRATAESRHRAAAPAPVTAIRKALTAAITGSTCEVQAVPDAHRQRLRAHAGEEQRDDELVERGEEREQRRRHDAREGERHHDLA